MANRFTSCALQRLGGGNRSLPCALLDSYTPLINTSEAVKHTSSGPSWMSSSAVHRETFTVSPKPFTVLDTPILEEPEKMLFWFHHIFLTYIEEIVFSYQKRRLPDKGEGFATLKLYMCSSGSGYSRIVPSFSRWSLTCGLASLGSPSQHGSSFLDHCLLGPQTSRGCLLLNRSHAKRLSCCFLTIGKKKSHATNEHKTFCRKTRFFVLPLSARITFWETILHINHI